MGEVADPSYAGVRDRHTLGDVGGGHRERSPLAASRFDAGHMSLLVAMVITAAIVGLMVGVPMGIGWLVRVL